MMGLVRCLPMGLVLLLTVSSPAALAQVSPSPQPDLRRLMVERAPLLLTLKQWNDAADEAVAHLPEILTALDRLPQLPPLLEACVNLPKDPTTSDDLTSMQVACALAGRARDIVERQYLASAKQAVRFAGLSSLAAKRYGREGRVSWHTLRIFATFEAEMAKRTEFLKPYASAIGLPILGELWKDGFVARRQLRQVMKEKRAFWPLPGDVTDTAFAAEVARAVPQFPQEGPMPETRGLLRQVRPVDPAWSVRTLEGRPVRRERRAATVWQPKRGPCYVMWLSARQAPSGRRWGPIRLVWEDDVRQVVCPHPAGAP